MTEGTGLDKVNLPKRNQMALYIMTLKLWLCLAHRIIYYTRYSNVRASLEAKRVFSLEKLWRITLTERWDIWLISLQPGW